MIPDQYYSQSLCSICSIGAISEKPSAFGLITLFRKYCSQGDVLASAYFKVCFLYLFKILDRWFYLGYHLLSSILLHLVTQLGTLWPLPKWDKKVLNKENLVLKICVVREKFIFSVERVFTSS